MHSRRGSLLFGNSLLLEVSFIINLPIKRFELPGPVNELDESIGCKLVDGDVIITLIKTESRHFRDIDLIGKLVVSSKTPKTKSLIQEIDDDNSNAMNLAADFTGPYDWFDDNYILSTSDDDEVSLDKPTYGFMNVKSGLFQVESELSHAIDLKDVDSVPTSERKSLRTQDEDANFSAIHYLSDLHESESWQSYYDFTSPWLSTESTAAQTSSFALTNDDRHRLMTLATTRPLPPPPISPSVSSTVYLGLVDIMLAYAYDYRLREGDKDGMSESGWNLAKLASTLSWLETFHTLPNVVVAFYRRALVFPLVRNWHFCRRVQADVVCLLAKSDVKEWLTKYLLDIRSALIDYPGYYVFADLYLDYYINWMQLCASQEVLNSLGSALEKYKPTKSDIGLDLLLVEAEGQKIFDQTSTTDTNLTSNMDKLTIN